MLINVYLVFLNMLNSAVELEIFERAAEAAPASQN